MLQETPGDMRQAEPVRDRLDMPGKEMLMPDRTGLHDLALLDAVGNIQSSSCASVPSTPAAAVGRLPPLAGFSLMRTPTSTQH